MSHLVKTLRSGQITIPANLRNTLGIGTDSFLQIRMVNGELRIKPVQVSTEKTDSAWMKKLYDRFAPVREEAQKYSEREVNKAIDKAVSAVRSKKHVKSRL